jgi:hypothetical protein
LYTMYTTIQGIPGIPGIPGQGIYLIFKYILIYKLFYYFLSVI